MASININEPATGQSEPSVDTPLPAEPVTEALPTNPLVLLQTAQFMILLVGALYLTRTIVLPIVLAILLKLLLQSGVRRLERIHIPRAVAALAMITILFVSW